MRFEARSEPRLRPTAGRRAILPLLTLLVFSVARSGAQEDYNQEGYKALRAARMLDVVTGELIEGPVILVAGEKIEIVERGPESGIADGEGAIVAAVRYQLKHGARVIKTCATAGVLSFEGSVGAQQYSEAELRALVEEAGRLGAKVAAHAHGSEGILAAVRSGVASIEHGSMLTAKIIEEMKARGTCLVPTTYLADAIDLENLPAPLRAKAEKILPLAKESLRLAIRSGVRVAFGTDAAVYPHGQIAPGCLADLIAVPGNPLENIRALEDVRFVMKGGEVVKRPTSREQAILSRE